MNAKTRDALAAVAAKRPMTADTIHTCSYSCDRPECIRAQRDELAARLMLRFDLSPAQKEGAIREHLIRLGWTPPDEHALSQQPEARGVVDEAMVKRFLEAFRNTPGDEAIDADEKVARRWLNAALATNRQEVPRG